MTFTNAMSIGVMRDCVAPLTGYFSKESRKPPWRKLTDPPRPAHLLASSSSNTEKPLWEEPSADALRYLAYVAAILCDPCLYVELQRRWLGRWETLLCRRENDHYCMYIHMCWFALTCFQNHNSTFFTDTSAVTLSFACSYTFRCRCRSHCRSRCRSPFACTFDLYLYLHILFFVLGLHLHCHSTFCSLPSTPCVAVFEFFNSHTLLCKGCVPLCTC